MPLHPPQASQARRSSSIALTGDGAPSRGLSAFRPATARRMFTPHLAVSSWVCRPVARIDASAKRTAAVSDLSTGNEITFAVGSDIGPTRRGDSAISGRRLFANRFGIVNASLAHERFTRAGCQRLAFRFSARQGGDGTILDAETQCFRHVARQNLGENVAPQPTRSGV